MAGTPRPGRPVRGSRTGRPIMALLDLLSRRWTLRVIWELREGRLTFRALQDACGGMSPTVLNAARATGERAAGIGGRGGLRAHAAGARADRAVPAAGRLVDPVGRRDHSRSRNPSVIALISGIPVRAIALMRALTSASGFTGLLARCSA